MASSSNAWFALQVRPRYEKLVATAIRNRGYEEFLPLYRCRRTWTDRIKDVDVPVFPGYLFCHMDLTGCLPVLTIPGVNRIVGSGREPLAVDEAELERVRAIVKSGLAAEPVSFLNTGQHVRIRHGVLAGIEGILIAIRGRHRVVVSITLLQRSVAVEVDSAWVEPAPPPHRMNRAVACRGSIFLPHCPDYTRIAASA